MDKNENTNTNGLSSAIKRQLELLKQAPTFYNMMNLVPSEVTWNVDVEKMEKLVADTAAKYLGADEVRMATIDPTSRSRAPLCFIWLKENSRHLVDASKGNNSNQVISPKVNRFSEDLKRFADQFAPTERPDGSPISRKKMIQVKSNRYGDKSIVAIPISIERVLKRLFDVENRGFIDTYGAGTAAPRCTLSVSMKYSTKRNGDLVLSYFRITKKLDTDGRHGRPRPVGSFNDRDDDED